MKKHVKLFEEFKHTHQEYKQVEKRYNDILNDKSVNISAKYHDQDIELSSTVKVWAEDGDLDGDYSYNLSLKRDGREVASVSIHNGKVDVWKERSISISDNEINKILQMVKDASDYISGVDMNDVEQELLVKLRGKK